ncbi:hypothetical protein COOONC_04861 [Cooperia oncophora]
MVFGAMKMPGQLNVRELLYLAREAISLRQKVVVTRQSLQFLKRCKASDISPRFVMNKELGSYHYQAEVYFIRCCLNAPPRKSLAEGYYRKKRGERLMVISEDMRAYPFERENFFLCKVQLFERRIVGECFSQQGRSTTPTEAGPQNPRQLNFECEAAKVTVVGNAQIFSEAMDFLHLGSSFSLTQTINPMTCVKFCAVCKS